MLRCSGLDSVLDFESVKIKIITTCNQICDEGICKEKTWVFGLLYLCTMASQLTLIGVGNYNPLIFVKLACLETQPWMLTEEERLEMVTTSNSVVNTNLSREEHYQGAIRTRFCSKDEFIEELDSLGVRLVPAILAELMKLIQRKDRETVAKLQILEKEMEFNPSQK
nr:hypothetical protein [Tanacetum cinerariifolium]